jgi:hypothetical protein
MELIQIIYSILIYGGLALFVVVLFSFMISKLRTNNLSHSDLPTAVIAAKYLNDMQHKYYSNTGNQTTPQRLNQSEQTGLRKLSQVQPQIFQIDRSTQRELKIVRKPTFHTNLQSTKDLLNDTQRNNTRYTIVNEQINNSKARVMNFYL